MTVWPVHARFDGPVVLIGFGSIGRGALPLLERHIAFDPAKFVAIDPVDTDRALLDERKLRFMKTAITRANYREVLGPLLKAGPGRGMIVNLSVDTSSADLMDFCKDVDAHYIDTVCEPWPGLYNNAQASLSARSNYALREEVLGVRRRRPDGVTAISCCGANPGMVVIVIVIVGVQELRLDVEDAIEIEGVAAENLVERHLRTLGSMQLGVGVDAADAGLDFAQFGVGHEIGLVDQDHIGKGDLVFRLGRVL